MQKQMQQQQRLPNQYAPPQPPQQQQQQQQPQPPQQTATLPYNPQLHPQHPQPHYQQQHPYDGYDHAQQGSLGRYVSPGHQGPPVQPGGGQAPVEHGSSSASVSESSPPRSESGSNLRFKISLEAQTAAMQRQDETPVTYLNKGQFYAVALKDTEEYDGDITSVIRVTFHDASHRRLAARYWSFWLSQQANPKTARALDIEKASSIGMMEIQSKTFDRISFKWNGKSGAKLMVRFNCLSTDFSRIKGVKGIPLRVHMDTFLNGNGNNAATATAHQDDPPPMERAFAKIKLFRDKGAERKNKDDHKHLEKMWDKMRGKNADTNPLVSMLAPVQTTSMFYECVDHPEGSEDEDTQDLSETLALQDQETEGGALVGDQASTSSLSSRPDPSTGTATSQTSSRSASTAAAATTVAGAGGSQLGPTYSSTLSASPSSSLALVSKKRRRPTEGGNLSSSHSSPVGLVSDISPGGYSSTGAGVVSTITNNSNHSNSNNNSLFIDRDPNYVPQHTNKRRPVLCLYIKIGGESVYRAVYLEKLTLADLVQKLSEKLEIQASTISGVYRKTVKKELLVKVDDAMVGHMGDEMDMVVDYDFNQLDGSVNLTLKY
ncbi:grainyhead-like [Mortierella alpina]|uniref:Grainyhead-like n=1 Tax=Mortierella alpina TaxID=64518 RepID=A0A9P6LYR5_MORAP|nr:grainyhead-like [Mortierella alpina]